MIVTAGTADLAVADECAAVLAAHGFRPAAHHRRRRGRPAPPPPPRRRAGRRRRRRGGGRHGGRAGQRGRRPHRGAGRGRADQRRLRRQPRAASRRCWPCWRRAPPASPSSASTTASARPAPWPGRATSGPGGRDHHRLVPPVLRHRRRHGARRRCSTPVPTVDEPCSALLAALPVARRHRRSRRCSGAASARPASSCPTSPTTTIAPTPTMRALLDAAAASRPRRTQRAVGRVRAAGRRRGPRSTASTPDEVEFHEVGSLDAIVDVVGTLRRARGARRRRGALGAGRRRHRHGPRRPRHPAQPGARRWWRCWPAARPTYGVDIAVELTTPDRRRAARRPGRPASARCRP